MIHCIVFVKLKDSERIMAKMLSTLLFHCKSNVTKALNGCFFSSEGYCIYVR